LEVDVVERLAGKAAIVTGAAQGIGRAIAQRLAEEGAAVVFADLNRPAAEATAAAVHADTGAPTLAVEVNVTDRAGVEGMVAITLARFGRLDILVNNAGIFGNVRFEVMTDEQWQRMINVNLTSVFVVSQVVVRHWLAHKTPGAIVNIASISGIVAFTDSSHYAAAKMGVIGLTRSLAMEMGPHGIRVNAEFHSVGMARLKTLLLASLSSFPMTPPMSTVKYSLSTAGARLHGISRAMQSGRR